MGSNQYEIRRSIRAVPSGNDLLKDRNASMGLYGDGYGGIGGI